MRITRILATGLLLTFAVQVQADPSANRNEPLLGKILPRWSSIDATISPERYAKLSRENQQDLERAGRRLLSSTFTTLGIPRQGAALTGAAIGLATKGLKFNLNEEKTLGLEFNRMTSEKRGIYLNFKLDW
ncbi:MAG TPA: hypothetical protein ENK50_10550 [Sedimenticola sp.]|nr:hypothetical protein [Sedimenticola sp.]